MKYTIKAYNETGDKRLDVTRTKASEIVQALKTQLEENKPQIISIVVESDTQCSC